MEQQGHAAATRLGRTSSLYILGWFSQLWLMLCCAVNLLHPLHLNVFHPTKRIQDLASRTEEDTPYHISR